MGEELASGPVGVRQTSELRAVSLRRRWDLGECAQSREQLDDPFLEMGEHDHEEILEEAPFGGVLVGQRRYRFERSAMRLLGEALPLASTAPGRDADPSTRYFAVAGKLERVDDREDYLFVLCLRLVGLLLAIVRVLVVVLRHRARAVLGPRNEEDGAEHSADRAVDLAGAVAYGVAPGLEHDGRIDEATAVARSEEHTSELQSHHDLVCRLLLEKKKKKKKKNKLKKQKNNNTKNTHNTKT